MFKIYCQKPIQYLLLLSSQLYLTGTRYERYQRSKGYRTKNTKWYARGYPRNMWWVAARSDEKGNSRWLLQTPVGTYRLEDGTPQPYDRCPHRWAPLSKDILRR